MKTKREIFSRPIPQNPPLDGPVLLKDGRPAHLRRAGDADLPALQALLERVSDNSMAYRFFGKARRGPDAAARLLASQGDHDGLTLVVVIGEGDRTKIVGVGSYAKIPDRPVAEVAFLVEDRHQGRGIGMLLLERLALGAAEAGLEVLEAVVLPDNQRMLRIFTDSGYEVTREFEGGDIMITFSIEPTLTSVEKAETRDRIATVASLIPFFHPRSIAVIGASRDPDHIGHRVLYNLVRSRFAGPVFPVNPRADVVASIPAYATVLDIQYDVDLAIIAVPPEDVLNVVDHCAEKGIRGVIVLSAGFAETGDAGRALQDQLVHKVRGNGMRLIGPNCLGLLNTAADVRLHGTFVGVTPLPGRVAMSSQSGALGLAVLEYAQELGLGFSSFVGVGNKADVSGNDLLQYWEEDAATEVILLYLESFGNPRRFANLARRIGVKKPILAVKGGRTTAGQRAAGSHTAAPASDDVVVEAFFEQTGVVRCDTLEEMFDIASILANQALPKGRRVAVLTNAGGPAILCADACEANGLELPPLSEIDRQRMVEALPRMASVHNPIDMTAFATADDYRRALTILLNADYIDAVIVMFTPIGTADSVDVEVAVSDAIGSLRAKTVVACFMGTRGKPQRLQTPTGVIPSYRFPEAAARALGRAVEYAEWRRRPQGNIVDFMDIDWQRVEDIVAEGLTRSGDGWLPRSAVESLMEAIGIAFAPSKRVETAAAAVRAASDFGFPVVVKPVSHVDQFGEWTGVHINLDRPDDVRRAYESVRRRLQKAGQPEDAAVVVQPMVLQGIEVMIRIVEEPGFGPVVALGLAGPGGGILKDAHFRIMPLTQNDATELVQSVRRWRLSEELPAPPSSDLEAVEEGVLRLSRLVQAIPEIVRLEINPLRIFPTGRGCQVLDARVRVQSGK